MIALLFLSYLTGNCFALLDKELILNYWSFKNVDYGTVYGCLSKQEEIDLVKSLSPFKSLSYFNVEDDEFELNHSAVLLRYNEHLGMVLDLDCSTSKFLSQGSTLSIFNDVHHWLMFMKQEGIDEVLKKVVLTISTDLVVAVPNVDGFLLFDVYNQAQEHDGKLIYNSQHYGTNKTFKKHREGLYSRRRDMTGVTFQTMVVLPKNYSGTLEEYLIDDTDREVNSFNRFHAVLVYHIKDYYNFSMNVIEGKSWGYKQPNGTFDGLVRGLELKTIDFGASPLFCKDERIPLVDYGRRTWLLRSAFIFRTPKRPASIEVFMRPLDDQVWYMIIVTILVITTTFYIVLRSERIYLKRIMISSFEATYSFLLLFSFGALCQQGASESPESVCCRILFLFVFIFALLLYQFYSASIVSNLLRPPARIINNLKDLAFSTLNLGCEDILYNKDYLNKLAGDPIINSLEHKTLPKSNVSFYCDPEVGLPLVARGGYAYHVEVATAYPIIEKTFDEDTICSLDEIQLFRTQQMFQPLQKNSPFRDMLNYVLQKIDEAGLMHRQLKHWHARKPECIRTGPPTSAVSIEEFYPALSFLAIGITLSLTVLVIEKIVKIRNDKKEEERLKKAIRNQTRTVFISRTE